MSATLIMIGESHLCIFQMKGPLVGYNSFSYSASSFLTWSKM